MRDVLESVVALAGVTVVFVLSMALALLAWWYAS